MLSRDYQCLQTVGPFVARQMCEEEVDYFHAMSHSASSDSDENQNKLSCRFAFFEINNGPESACLEEAKQKVLVEVFLLNFNEDDPALAFMAFMLS